MIRLRDRNAEESADFHRINTPSPRFDQTGQRDRITLSRQLVEQAISLLKSSGQKHIKILEPGCGRADISGPFSKDHEVVGYEVCEPAAEAGRRDWPSMTLEAKDAQILKPESSDILITTEYLEHIEDPFKFVRGWMSQSKYCVLSSPVAGDRGKFKEGGHIWSFDRVNFDQLFEEGNQEIIHFVEFRMGGYDMFLGLGRRKGLAHATGQRIKEPVSTLVIRLARQAAVKALRTWNPEAVHRWGDVAALDAGEFEGDIAGHFSMGHHVAAFETDIQRAVNAQKKWPWLSVHGGEFKAGSKNFVVGIAPVRAKRIGALGTVSEYLVLYGSGQDEREAVGMAKSFGKTIYRERVADGSLNVFALAVQRTSP